jgi:uncharacterized protein (DUF362 family)
MSILSRRGFLASAVAAGASSLSAETLPAFQAAKPADMTIARWTGPKPANPAEFKNAAVKATEQAIAGLGGLKRFISKGDVVWVKPNIGWDRTPEQAANTNPDVLATVIRLCFEAGAKTVKVGDNPVHPAPKAYASSGLADVAKAAGAEVLILDPSRFREMAIGGERVKSLPVYPGIVECDLVINVPIAKHHRLAELTLCMKNFMGVIEQRNTFHQAIAPCLADLTRFLKPRLSVLDCMRVLTAHGPSGGNLEDVVAKMTVAAGIDIVAMDAFGAEIMDRKPTDIPSVVAGVNAGLGKIDYRSLALQEISVS